MLHFREKCLYTTTRSRSDSTSKRLDCLAGSKFLDDLEAHHDS